MNSHDQKPTATFSVTNCICNDQRVLKMAETVEAMGYRADIVGRITVDCCEADKIPFKTRRFRMLFRRGFLFYKFFNIRLFFYLLFHKTDILVANDLDTLLPNYIISGIKRIPVVFDSHEYFTGVPEIQNRPLVKWVWKEIERSVLPHLRYVITVSNSIGELYEKEYGVSPLIVRNCSKKADAIVPISRKDLHIPENNLLLIMQGTGINVDRGGEELIDAVMLLEDVFLLIVGSGDVLPLLKKKVDESKVSDRVRFIDKLPWEEMMRYTKAADLGLSLDKDTNLNYRYSLPNKLFDYIAAGIPVLAGHLPEVNKLITENSFGVTIREVTPKDIAKAIGVLNENREMLKFLRHNASQASDALNWDEESKKVIDFYRNIKNNKL